MLIPVSYLALQAIVAFVIDNLAGGFDGGYLALMGAGLAGLATFVASAQPFKNAEACHEA